MSLDKRLSETALKRKKKRTTYQLKISEELHEFAKEYSISHGIKTGGLFNLIIEDYLKKAYEILEGNKK